MSGHEERRRRLREMTLADPLIPPPPPLPQSRSPYAVEVGGADGFQEARTASELDYKEHSYGNPRRVANEVSDAEDAG